MRILFSLAALTLFGACAGSSLSDTFDSRQNAGACPPSGSLYDAARIIEFEEPENTSFNNITFTGEITNVDLYCRYAGTDPVRAEIEIEFAFGRGDRGAAQSKDFRYWVAVIRRSGRVLNKEYFTVRADFSDGPVTAAQELVQRIVIPRADESVSAANFEVIVGFDLTDEQLTFNRDGRRFRLDAGQ